MDILDASAALRDAKRLTGTRSFVARGVVCHWPATKQWTPRYFSSRYGDTLIAPKRDSPADGVSTPMKLSDFYRETRDRTFHEFPYYVHDAALSGIDRALCADVGEMPLDMMPRWYNANFRSFLRLFWGPAGAVTPFHFDTLATHNVFFQIYGRKRFRIVDAPHREACYLKNWRWSEIVDPGRADPVRFPAFARIPVQEIDLAPGDMLYMPPMTMHFVESMEESIALNIDWHSKGSALLALLAHARGMPPENLGINCRLAAGVWLGLPVRWLFRSLAIA